MHIKFPNSIEISLIDRVQTKRGSRAFRSLAFSLLIHSILLSGLLLLTRGIQSERKGPGDSNGDGPYSVTWMPGDGKPGAKGTGDNTVSDDQAGNELEPEAPVPVRPARPESRMFPVEQIKPDEIFDAKADEKPLIEPLTTSTRKTSAVDQEKMTAIQIPNRDQNTENAGGMPSPDSAFDEDAEIDVASGRGLGRGIGGGTDGGGRSGSGTGDTTFFGILSRPKRIVYVIDASSSMEQYDAMNTARRELWTSLKQLTPTTQFQIVFFNLTNHRLERSGDRWQLWPASSANLRLAKKFLQGIQPEPGTDRFQAISLALTLNPDVIYLLTDVDPPELATQDLANIRRANKRNAKIHVIEFGDGVDLSPDTFLKKLARQNRGEYVYRDLRRPPN